MSRFRDYLYPAGHPRIADLEGLDAYDYVPVAQQHHFTGELIRGWRELYDEPYVGVTSNGEIVPNLFELHRPELADAAPVAAMVSAAERLFATLDAEQRERISYPIDSLEWRHWANPEFLQFDTGLRLEFQSEEVREAFLALVAASLSEQGAHDVRTMMRINGFLGDVVGLPGILGEFSYNVAIFGEPSLTEPWGWQLFGHHCAVNCLVVDGQMVVSPVFLGAEPNEIDEGPHAGTVVFIERIAIGRQIMAALTEAQRRVAVTSASLTELPPGRHHPGDERHLGGAFQDNRVIPYEGVRVAELSESAQELVWQFVAEFVSILPEGAARLRMREVREHLADTWFSWMGGTGPDDPYYCRVQNPVIIVELDHHCGVFLSNEVPQPFHIHTVMRTPNGNDYGHALVQQARAARQA